MILEDKSTNPNSDGLMGLYINIQSLHKPY